MYNANVFILYILGKVTHFWSKVLQVCNKFYVFRVREGRCKNWLENEFTRYGRRYSFTNNPTYIINAQNTMLEVSSVQPLVSEIKTKASYVYVTVLRYKIKQSASPILVGRPVKLDCVWIGPYSNHYLLGSFFVFTLLAIQQYLR